MAPSTRSNATLTKGEDGTLDVKKTDEPRGEKRKTDDGEKEEKSKAVKEDKDDVRASSASSLDPDAVSKLAPGSSEKAQQDEGEHRVLEEGVLYLFYRPKVQAAEEVQDGKAAESIDDVQNTHLLLVPVQSESSTASLQDASKPNDDNARPAATTGEAARTLGVGYRLIRLGKKRLPAPEQAIRRGLEPGGIGGDSSETIWSCISDIGQDVAQLRGEMGERRYSTRTRGERVVGASRMVGRGRYALMHHLVEPKSRQSVRLVYAVSHPSEMGEVQKELGLQRSGSVRLSMRNPTLSPTTNGRGGGGGAPPAAGLPKESRVVMSEKELNDEFGGPADGGGGTRYADPSNVELLDREGVEILMTRERFQTDATDKSMGKQQARGLEDEAQKEGKRLDVQDVLREMALSSDENPPDAIQGVWV